MATKLTTFLIALGLLLTSEVGQGHTAARMRKSTIRTEFNATLCASSGGVWGTALIASGACDWLYTTPGTYTWTVPTGVTKVSVVCIGGGGGSSMWNGGGGGGLVYKNNIAVTPGSAITVAVGAGGTPSANATNSSFNLSIIAYGGGTGVQGTTAGVGGSYSGGDGGGNGGTSGSVNGAGGAGGAGGYSGAGGNQGSAGTGGGGGGGGWGNGAVNNCAAGAGGGTGLFGLGSNGTGGITASNYGIGGDGGSGGSAGGSGACSSSQGGVGGTFGGGAGGGGAGNGGYGAGGACRIVWGSGPTLRTFPSTLVGASNPIIGDDIAGRTYADGTYATSCYGYRAGSYDGATGDGVYWIKPSTTAFRVYCDMTTEGGGWTLVDNDASTSTYFSTRAAGANDSITTTRGSYLPAYIWSPNPQLLVKSSHYSGARGWVIFTADDAYAREYPTQTTATALNLGTFGIKTLNGNTNNGSASWIFVGSTRFGSVWLGGGSAATAACSYTNNGTNFQNGTGGSTSAGPSTCSTWVR